MRLRHPYNRNLKLHYGDFWEGLPVYTSPGGLIVDYLEELRMVMDCAIDDNNRVMAFRVDVRFPDTSSIWESVVITRFIASFKAKIEAAISRKMRAGGRAYPCRIRFVWAKERADALNHHYHLVVMINRDAFFTLGKFKTASETERAWGSYYATETKLNLSDRVISAWASALDIPCHQAVGLVHFPENPTYTLDVNSPEFYQQYAAAFHRFSYLTKADTKTYGDYSRHFGCSRG